MKVCLLNDAFPPVVDGVVNVMMNYARYLMSDFHAEVIIGTPRYPEADYSQYPYPVVAYPSFGTGAEINGYRTGNPFDGKAVSALADFGPDIIHSHCPATATIVARLLREKKGAPVILTYHTKYEIDLARLLKGKVVLEEGVKAMVRNIEACDEVWAVSRGAGESLKALGFQGDIRVVNNGVDFARGRVDKAGVQAATAGYDLPEGVPMFLFVGRMMTYKGIPLILDAMRMLSDAGQDFRMVFIGRGPDQELLEQKMRELDLADTETTPGKCLFIGPVYDRDVLRAWNTRADLFLFPSTFDTNGLVVREAAACGLASVLVAGSCAAENITDNRNGFLIEETAESMAAFLKEACRDVKHLHDVGQHAMDEIYLSWQDCVAEAYDRYGFLLEEKARGALPAHRKQPEDYLVTATARGMEQQDWLRKLGRELFHDFRETAEGMRENIRGTEDGAESFLDRLSDNIQEAGERVDHAMGNAMGKLREGLKRGRKEGSEEAGR